MPYLQVAYLEQHSCGKEEPMPDYEINYLGSLMVMVQRQNQAPGSFCHPLALLSPTECVTSPGQLEGKGDKKMAVGGISSTTPTHQGLMTLNVST